MISTKPSCVAAATTAARCDSFSTVRTRSAKGLPSEPLRGAKNAILVLDVHTQDVSAVLESAA